MPQRIEEETLKRLSTDTEGAISRMRERTNADGSELSSELIRLNKLMAKGGTTAEQKKIDEAIGVVTAKLGEQKPLNDIETKDLAQSVMGMQVLAGEIGHELAGLEVLSTSEQGIINAAKQIVKEAEENIATAKTAWFYKDAKIAAAETALTEANTGVDTATAKAKNLQRHRLLSADMDTSLQSYMAMVANASDIIVERTKSISEELKAVTIAKQRTQAVRKASMVDYEKAQKRVTALKTSLTRAEADIESIAAGTSERTEAEQKLSDVRKQLVEAEGEVSQALAIVQSKEKFGSELEIHETAQQKLLDNNKMWIAVLKSNSEEQVVTFHSRLEAMKSEADQMIAAELTKVGESIDQSNATMMARIGRASDDARMSHLETHPERMRQMQKVREAQAEAHRTIEARFGDFIKEFDKNYGINSLDASFVNEPKDKAA